MKPVHPEHRDLLEDLNRVRAEAPEHARHGLRLCPPKANFGVLNSSGGQVWLW